MNYQYKTVVIHKNYHSSSSGIMFCRPFLLLEVMSWRYFMLPTSCFHGIFVLICLYHHADKITVLLQIIIEWNEICIKDCLHCWNSPPNQLSNISWVYHSWYSFKKLTFWDNTGDYGVGLDNALVTYERTFEHLWY